MSSIVNLSIYLIATLKAANAAFFSSYTWDILFYLNTKNIYNCPNNLFTIYSSESLTPSAWFKAPLYALTPSS